MRQEDISAHIRNMQRWVFNLGNASTAHCVNLLDARDEVQRYLDAGGELPPQDEADLEYVDSMLATASDTLIAAMGATDYKFTEGHWAIAFKRRYAR